MTRIPKNIHLIWFGRQTYNQVIQTCLASWSAVLPDYHIHIWNEDTYSLSQPHIPQWVQNTYEEKKFAFVADYVRADILCKYGGIYLDTDMYMVRPIDTLLDTDCFLAREDDVHISAGIIACVPEHPFLLDLRNQYTESHSLTPIPIILTELYNTRHYANVTILAKNTFYPFSQETISRFKYSIHNVPQETFGVHMWNYSWGPWYARILHTFPLYHSAKRALEKIGLKKLLKKLLKMP